MGLFDRKEETYEVAPIAKVKLLGIRTYIESGVLGSERSTLYCFLVERTDGTRFLTSCTQEDEALQELIYYIPMD